MDEKMTNEKVRRQWEKECNGTKKINYYGFCDFLKCPQKEQVRNKIADGIRYIKWLEEKIIDLSNKKEKK